MNTEDMTPEEIQAINNSRKIRGFIGGLGWQGIVLTTVVYATVLDNEVADWLLNGYVGMLIGAMLFTAPLLFISLQKIAATLITKGPEFTSTMTLNTPSVKVGRVVAGTFSLIEIALLTTNGWYIFAGLWVLGETIQWLAIARCRTATKLEFEPETKYAREVGEQLQEFEKDLDRITALIEAIKTDDTLEQDVREDSVDALTAEREKMILDIEKYLTKIALEHINGDKE